MEERVKAVKALNNRIIQILTFAHFLPRNVQQFYEMLEAMDLKQIHRLEKGKFMKIEASRA